MSHASGVEVSSSLSLEFGNAVESGQVRLFQVQIADEKEFVTAKTVSVSGDWQKDFAQVHSMLDENPLSCSYIIYRLDTQNNLGNEWVLLCYVPDKAKVREKMVYASSRSKLKSTLGGGRITSEMFGTIPKDFTLESYNKYVTSQNADAPLTRAEMDRQEEMAQGVFVGGQGTGSVPGVSFPVQDDVLAKLKEIAAGNLTYLEVVIEKEVLKVGSTGNIDLHGLPAKISPTEPRFHFFTYSHTFEGNNLKSILFIYSCPDGSGGTQSAPVKLRMLYSSSKANMTNITQSLNMEIAAKLEVNKGEDLTEEMINHTLHPAKEEPKEKTVKPKAPGRGPRKLIR